MEFTLLIRKKLLMHLLINLNGFKNSLNLCLLVSNSTDFLSLPKITVDDVSLAIKKLKPNKSKGTDGIPNFIIKGCSNILIPVLTFIFNLSLLTGTYPMLWKEASIIPIFKNGKKMLFPIIDLFQY